MISPRPPGRHRLCFRTFSCSRLLEKNAANGGRSIVELPTFTHPWSLLLLAAIPPLVVAWYRRGHGALRFSATSLFAGLGTGRGGWARRGGAVLRAAALILIIVAMTGPRWPQAGTRIPTQGIAIAMVVDVSASMAN